MMSEAEARYWKDKASDLEKFLERESEEAKQLRDKIKNLLVENARLRTDLKNATRIGVEKSEENDRLREALEKIKTGNCGVDENGCYITPSEVSRKVLGAICRTTTII